MVMKALEKWALKTATSRVAHHEKRLLEGNLLSKFALNLLLASKEHLSHYTVIRLDISAFHVSSAQNEWNVLLDQRKCSCKRYDDLGIPCVHGLAAIMSAKLEVANFVDPCFHTTKLKECYSGRLIPPIQSDFALAEGRLPPVYCRQPGRPKKRRIPSAGATDASKTRNKNMCRKNRKCSICQQAGHYALTCNGLGHAVEL
jgi:hypothetical protein